LKLGFGLRKDAPIEEIEIDISSFEEEEEEVEEADIEGDIEVDDITYDKIDIEEEGHHKEDLWVLLSWIT